MRSVVRTIAIAGIALATSHCGGAGSKPEPKNATEQTPSGTPRAESTTVPSAVALASSTPPPAPESPFQPIAELPAAGTLFSVDGALLVAWAGQLDGGMGYSVGAVVDDKLIVPQSLFFNTFMGLIVGIGGTYPDKLQMAVIGSTGRTGIAEHYVQSKDGWQLKRSAEGYYYAGLASTKDSLIALKLPTMPWPGMSPSFDALQGSVGGRKLTPTSKSCPKEEGNPFTWSTDVRVTAFGGTGAGALFALGTRCDDKPAVEVWPAGSKTSTITELPEGVGTIDESTKFASGTNTAWMFGDKVLFFDGGTWTAVDKHPGLVDGAVAPDGTLWAIGQGGTLHKGTTKGFEEIRVPANATVDDVAVTPDGTVWISAGGALLRTKKANEPPSLVNVAKASKTTDKKAKSPPKFGGPKCKSNVVVLYGFTKVTPDDYDFPLTRKALKGHSEFSKTRFVVTKDYGQKFFSALVPSFEDGKKLVSVIEKGVQGSKPQIVCAEPEVLRELKINFTTGDVIK